MGDREEQPEEDGEARAPEVVLDGEPDRCGEITRRNYATARRCRTAGPPMPHRTQMQVIKRRLVGKEGSERVRELRSILADLPNYKSGPYADIRKWVNGELRGDPDAGARRAPRLDRRSSRGRRRSRSSARRTRASRRCSRRCRASRSRPATTRSRPRGQFRRSRGSTACSSSSSRFPA